MTETLTREDVQLHTGTDPEKHAHIVLKREYLPGEQLEALCGYRWTPTQYADTVDPARIAKPVCPACVAVYEDNDARGMAAGWKGPSDV